MKKCISTYLIVVIIICGCKTKLTPSESRIYVLQEFNLNNTESFFWFRNEQEVMHEGLNYFQIASDKCNLSTEAANAYCQLPEEVLSFRNDTIFILTRSDINFTNKKSNYKIHAVGYENSLYDISKRPNKDSMYFLDTICH